MLSPENLSPGVGWGLQHSHAQPFCLRASSSRDGAEPGARWRPCLRWPWSGGREKPGEDLCPARGRAAPSTFCWER